jgi:hypothetical protein
MDVASYGRWYSYSRARDLMLKYTDMPHAPWVVVPSDDKRRARLNALRHILDTIPHKVLRRKKAKLPARSKKGAYDDRRSLQGRTFVNDRYS